eukprot:scaffold72014_cov66-Phaeocystis_antarctica.AAC.4
MAGGLAQRGARLDDRTTELTRSTRNIAQYDRSSWREPGQPPFRVSRRILGSSMLASLRSPRTSPPSFRKDVRWPSRRRRSAAACRLAAPPRRPSRCAANPSNTPTLSAQPDHRPQACGLPGLPGGGRLHRR